MTIIKAVCVLRGKSVEGTVHFEQAEGSETVKVTGQISDLQKGLHAFHIYDFGYDTNGDEGAHFNPLGKDHGGPDHDVLHVGDLENVKAGTGSIAEVNIIDSMIQLSGSHSIIGRTLVVHADPDDLGQSGHELSKITGNTHLACGVIVISN
ncbi:PREDICTED: superoxide dismutase [Cu-Zn]-like [Wasmannia auropunctata]|uniref:superoxide dismutase [Cu-Zn]-like n=1 Tax=Wasmannia auropunctata TaxID=64793 RepID=UPI0005EEF2FA|nr:PREDICTED: superoxide dismutase [Cu-Zn]-like [Wasmannia auropunctata]